jgi:hypothetical protein
VPLLLCAAVLFVRAPLGAAAPWPHGDPNAVARSVLAQPAFTARPQTDETAPLIFKVFRWIGERLGPLFRWFSRRVGGAARYGAWLAYGLFAAAAVAVAAAAFAFAARLVQRRRNAEQLAATESIAAANATVEAARSAAAAAARAGDHRRAIAMLFRAALLALDRAALVHFDAARTPGEYRRSVRRAAVAAAAPFDDLAGLFVRATFGAATVLRDDYDAASRAYAAVALSLSTA